MGIFIHTSKCHWSTYSKTDKRFNLHGKCDGVFDTTPMEEAIKNVERKHKINRPNDIEYGIWKD